MTPLIPILMLSVVAAGPQVDIGTLTGEQHAGRLQRLSADSLSIETDAGAEEIPLSEVMDVNFTQTAAAVRTTPQAVRVTLVDGTRIACSKVVGDVRAFSLETRGAGNFQVPAPRVAQIRFAAEESQVDELWNELCARPLVRDLLVVRKGNVLDHLDGAVGGIDESSVKFVLDGEEISVKREKVFGLVFARRKADGPKPVCEISLQGGDLLKVESLSWDDSRFTARLVASVEIELPVETLSRLDFSLGKVSFLSQMEPREVKYTPFFDVTWEYRRDQNLDGGPIRLGNKSYRRGLALHSRTYLRYRLGGEFRRFQAVMGIDRVVERRGNVHVVISGDGKPLLEADVRGSDPPQPLDLDVSGVRDLEILVDFGEDLDIADHLDLADAKVIK